MTMAITPAQTGRISGIFWRRPALGLFLLLLGPLMWFGIVYLGSLLTLLWQSIYTFDDFTMSVTSDFTLANLRALFNPANYDIIVRTLVMALCNKFGKSRGWPDLVVGSGKEIEGISDLFHLDPAPLSVSFVGHRFGVLGSCD